MINFNELVLGAMSDDNQHMRPVIEKEILHYDILFSLEKEGLLDSLTFQGGTSLRLCYGSFRFSEDLDFTGGRAFNYKQMEDLRDCLMDYIGGLYGLEVLIKSPSEGKPVVFNNVNVSKWQVSVITAPAQRDLPRQRIKIEVANIDSYTREKVSLKRNYAHLPDGYKTLLIGAQTLDEIMADKVVSLVNTDGYVRHRDIWDLAWLSQERAELNTDFVLQKLDDYGVDFDGYIERLDEKINQMQGIVTGVPFLNEMRRFLTKDVQNKTINEEAFLLHLSSVVSQILKRTSQGLIPPTYSSYESFKM